MIERKPEIIEEIRRQAYWNGERIAFISRAGELTYRELWEKLIPLMEKHRLTWNWVKGHAGHIENERVDAMACLQRDNFSNLK